MPTRKLVAATIVGVVTFALTKLAVQLDPVLEQALNVAAMIAAGYLVPNAEAEPAAAAYYEPENPDAAR